MKKYILILLLALLLPLSSAFMPPTHLYIQNRVLDEFGGNSQLYQDCMADPELCFAGNIMSDLSVVYYYTDGMKYVATHQPIFCQSMLQQATNSQEKACAVGACLHQTQDMRSHNVMVEYAITHTGMSNAVIHTFAEQHIDNVVQDRVPGIKENALDVDRWDECRPLLVKVLGGFSTYDDITEEDLNQVIDKFLDEVSGSVTSYDVAFRKKGGLFDNFSVIPLPILALYLGTLLLWLLLFVLLIFRKDKTYFNYFSMVILLILIVFQGWLFIANLRGLAFVTFIQYISPFSNFVPIGDADSHLNTAVSNGVQFFTVGESWLINTDADGFENLKNADSKVLLIDYALLVFVLVILVLFIRANFRRSNKITF